MEIYETNFPYKQVTAKPNNVKSPWMSKALRKSSFQKLKLYVKYLKQKTTESKKTYKEKIGKNNFYVKKVIKMSTKYQEIMANNEINNR